VHEREEGYKSLEKNWAKMHLTIKWMRTYNSHKKFANLGCVGWVGAGKKGILLNYLLAQRRIILFLSGDYQVW